jgi:molybdate transport system substrate-binding protein
MPNLRRSMAILSVLVVLGAGLLESNQADASSPPKCTKAGATWGGNIQFRCVKSGNGLVWVRSIPAAQADTFKANLNVFGAASLTAVLPKLAKAFHALHPNVRFRFSFAGSSLLAQQITAGAPADLFFSAGQTPMGIVGTAGDVDGRASNFTSNSLVIAVPPGNPANISELASLARPGVTFIICAPQVPCGSAAARVLSLSKIVAQPVSLENDVKMVLSRVAMHEVDAGLVYRTDITKDVMSIDFPEAKSAVNEYPAAVIKGSRSAISAHAFVNFVLSQAGQTILHKAGFGKR